MFTIFDVIALGLFAGGVMLMQFQHIRELKQKLAWEQKSSAYQNHLERRLRKALDALQPGSYEQVREIVEREWDEAHRVDGGYDFTSPRVPSSIPDLWPKKTSQSLDYLRDGPCPLERGGCQYPSSTAQPNKGSYVEPAPPEQPYDASEAASSISPEPTAARTRPYRTVKYADDGWGELEIPTAVRRAQERKDNHNQSK